MKYFRCILSSIIGIFLCMSAFTGTATAVENNSPPIDVTTCQTNPIELTDEQQDTLNKIVSVGTHFKYVDNQLIITLNESELKNTYGFSESQYTFLQDTVLGATHADNTSFARVPASPSGAMAKCDGWYISHSDLTVGIATAVTVAAGIGPALDDVEDRPRQIAGIGRRPRLIKNHVQAGALFAEPPHCFHKIIAESRTDGKK